MTSRVLALAAALSLAGAAEAHSPVQSYSPKSGATVARSLDKVAIRYTGTVRSGTLVVRGPGGAKVSRRKGHIAAKGKVLRARLRGGLSAGSYTATYRTVHADGDATSGSWSFRLR